MKSSPSRARQFRVLYRDFLSRMIDIEVLSARGELQALLGQFAAMLAALSFVMTVYLVPRYGTSPLPHARLLTLAWLDEEFLIGTTMAIAGMFSVLAWNAVMPDLRDALVLGPLPVATGTICRAKIAALTTSLAVSVLAVNAFTGLAYPAVLSLAGGFFGFLRSLAAYWIVMAAAGAFISAALLAVQGIAAQVLSYRLFQRASSFLQIAAFFTILGVYFLKPPLATMAGLTAPAHRHWIEWLPTYWFLGLFQVLNGSMHPVFGQLAARALEAFALALGLAAIAYVLAYRRGLRRIVEQPDIAPGDRTRAASGMARWLAAKLLPESIDRAIVLFTARTIARSRQHRLILAAYVGIALAIAMAYLKSYLYGTARVWGDAEISLLTPSVVMMVFAVIGARAVFALPILLPANWIFRVTAVHSPQAYFSAARKALAGTAVIPVWVACAAVYLALWRGAQTWQHLLVLSLLGAILVFASMLRFRKVPFACSYLPGKANLKVKLGMYGILFLFLCDNGVRVEVAALHAPRGFVILIAILIAAAFGTWWRTQRLSASPAEKLQFEELPVGDLLALDLDQGPGGEVYIDRLYIEDLSYIPREPVSLATRVEQIARDLWLGFRALAKSPGFSAAAIAVIAMGIGGNTAIYSMIHGVLTRPAPGVMADRLVSFGTTVNGMPEEPESSYLEYLTYGFDSRTVHPLAASGFGFFTLALKDGSYELRGQRVTQNYFETIGVPIVRGRGFTADEAYGRAPLAAILAYHIWQNQFHGDAAAIGQVVEVNGCPATIIGVTAPGFRGLEFAPHFEIGLPLEGYARVCNAAANPRAAVLALIGRLAPRATLTQARAEFAALGKSLQQAYPDVQRGRMPQLSEYSATAFSPIRSAQAMLFMRVLSAVGILTLLIVCANVANLMLARSVARQREMAVRRALGAPHARILRLLFAEGLALSLAAAAAAWVFARWATSAIVKLIPPLSSGARIEPDLAPDSAVAIYALALAALSALAFTAAPAIRAWRQEVLPWLKAGEHGVVAGRSPLANLLAGAQLALCVVLLTGAGLASRSLYLIGTTDLHFKKDHLLLVNVNTSGAAQGGRQNIALLERLRQRVGGLPGVTAASYASAVPPGNFGGWAGPVQDQGAAQTFRAAGMNAGPGLIETLGVPLAAGRSISVEDVTGGRSVAVINRHLADTLWPKESPLGRTVMVFGEPAEVIGVAVNAAMATMQGANANYVFLPERQTGSRAGGRVLYVRYATDEAGAAAAVRAAIRETDSRIPVSGARTMEEELETDNAPQIMVASLLGVFSTGSLIVAAIGLYAVVAFHTARRTRDFGIRLALGASSGEILQSVLRDGLVVAAVGSGLGVALSLAASRLFASLLVAVTPTDLLTYCGVIALVTVVSLAACVIPARRAAQVDPVVTLRQE
jgi:predicted permease